MSERLRFLGVDVETLAGELANMLAETGAAAIYDLASLRVIAPDTGLRFSVTAGLRRFLRLMVNEVVNRELIEAIALVINQQGNMERLDTDTLMASVVGGRVPVRMEAVPDGTIIFSGEPVLQITGPLIWVMLVGMIANEICESDTQFQTLTLKRSLLLGSTPWVEIEWDERQSISDSHPHRCLAKIGGAKSLEEIFSYLRGSDDGEVVYIETSSVDSLRERMPAIAQHAKESDLLLFVTFMADQDGSFLEVARQMREALDAEGLTQVKVCCVFPAELARDLSLLQRVNESPVALVMFSSSVEVALQGERRGWYIEASGEGNGGASSRSSFSEALAEYRPFRGVRADGSFVGDLLARGNACFNRGATQIVDDNAFKDAFEPDVAWSNLLVSVVVMGQVCYSISALLDTQVQSRLWAEQLPGFSCGRILDVLGERYPVAILPNS